MRPFGLARAHVAPLRHLGGFVWYGFARYRVRLEGGAVPAAEQLAVGLVVGQFLRIPGQHGVAAFDVAVVVHHGFGHGLVAAAADVPLQVADPQHQLGQGGGARVQLDAQKLLQRDGFAFKAQLVLRVAQGFKLVDDFAFQALQVFQRHIQKVGAATGRIQHAHAAQLVQKLLHFGAGFGALCVGGLALQRGGFVRQHQGGGLGVGPVGAQRRDDGRQHQPLDIRTRGVVRAQCVALGGVQRAFQQGAEYGGLYLAPVAAGGGDQQVDLIGRQQQAVAVFGGAFEQLAVEVQHLAGQRGAEPAPVHVVPQDAQHLLQRGGVVAVGLQQAAKSAFGQQLNVFREHGKQAAHKI